MIQTPDERTSPRFNPKLCATCWGSGFMRHDVPYGDPRFGQLTTCTRCDRPTVAALARCWEVSAEVGGLDLRLRRPPTLETFTPHDDAARAMLDAALDFVTAAPDARGWLTIHGCGQGQRGFRRAGHHGAGKSHLGEAIARDFLEQQKIPALYASLGLLLEYLGAVYPLRDDIDYDRRLRWAQELPILVLDEVNKERDSDATHRKRQELLDGRYRRAIAGLGGATVLLSNDDPGCWQDPAIASRACDNRFVVVQATAVDYRRFVAHQEAA